MNKFPTRQQLDKAMKKMARADAGRPLPKNADQVDKFKYSLCREILMYKLENKMTLDQMAELLDLSKTDISKIINYHIERYTLDKLIRLALIINPNSKYGKVAGF